MTKLLPFRYNMSCMYVKKKSERRMEAIQEANYDTKQEKEDHRNRGEKETEADKVLSVPQTTQNLWTGLCEVWGQIARRS